ncbi:MAG: hypothetical protein WKF66_18625 [Pedobacter sp.]
MKKIIVSLILFLGGVIPMSSSAQININIGSQPLWGPTGYEHVDYYYIPDIESYYYVPTREFIYSNNGKWVFSSAKPAAYSNYNLYNGYKVVINSPKPYLRFDEQKVKYAKYKSNRSQLVISRSNDPKYFVIKGHPKATVKKNVIKNSSAKSKVHMKAKGNGNGKSKGKGR